MSSMDSGDRRWAKRHAWVVVLIAVQAIVVAGAAVFMNDQPLYALAAVLTIVAPAVATSVPRFSKTAIAAFSAATLLSQAVLVILVFGNDIRPNVILLADLCVIALYEIPVLFAASFAAATALIVGLTAAQPTLFNIDPHDTTGALIAIACGILATSVAAIAIVTLWLEHQRVQHVAAEQQRVTDAYLQVTGSILIVMDRHGIVTIANRQACLTLDREQDEIVGREWFDLALPEEYRDRARQLYAMAYDPTANLFDGSNSGYENELISASGERRQVTWWGTMLTDRHGKPVGMVSSGTDVTEFRRTNAEVERGRVELDALRRLAQKVASLDDSRQAVCDAALALAGAQMAAISEPDRTRETLTYTTSTNRLVNGLSVHLGREASLVGTAFLSGQPQFISNLESAGGVNSRLADHVTTAVNGEIRSALHQPIVGANGTLGVLTVSWDHAVESLGDRRAELVGLIAHEAAIALRRRESLAQLERAALVDPLTGVANRRAFDAELPLALRRATEGNYPVALVAMDLNEFKAVNDVLGHEAGDDVLINAAGAWAEALRAGDLLARIGGDEFSVVLPTCDEIEMNHIVARLRSVTPHGPGTSIGGAMWDGSETVSSLIRRADAAQYEDKARSKQEVRRTPSGTPSRTPARRQPRRSDPRTEPPLAAGDGASGDA